MLKRFACIIAVLKPAPLLAHAGHGHIEAASSWHWLLEFEHSGWLLPALLVLFVLLRKRRG